MTQPEAGLVDFRGFIASLAATALVTVNNIEQLKSGNAADSEAEPPSPEEAAKQLETAQITARHIIDAIAMLEAKTAGNLTDDEHQFVQTTLTELRMAYVRVAGPAKRS